MNSTVLTPLSSKITGHLGRLLALLLLVASVGASGCAHAHPPVDQSVEDQGDLQLTVQTFHRDMRWKRWESAAIVVAPAERAQFLARYDELGDDFHISNLEMKSLAHVDKQVIIDMEQETYTEPAMIVKKKRYIEVWEKPDGNWLMTRRMPKKDYEEMKKVEAAQKFRGASEAAEPAAGRSHTAKDREGSGTTAGPDEAREGVDEGGE